MESSSSSTLLKDSNSNVPFFEFDKTDDITFFLCRKCKAHLTPMQDFIERYVRNGKQYAHFESLVNVKRDRNNLISNGKITVQATYCIKCGTDLGFRFIELKQATDPDIKQGQYLLYLNKLLLYRNGQELDPETEELLRDIITDEQKAMAENLFKTLQI